MPEVIWMPTKMQLRIHFSKIMANTAWKVFACQGRPPAPRSLRFHLCFRNSSGGSESSWVYLRSYQRQNLFWMILTIWSVALFPGSGFVSSFVTFYWKKGFLYNFGFWKAEAHSCKHKARALHIPWFYTPCHLKELQTQLSTLMDRLWFLLCVFLQHVFIPSGNKFT